MGRWGDWAKGNWKETVRVKVAYQAGEPPVRYEIVTVVPRKSLNYNRDAADRVRRDLAKARRGEITVLTTEVEGEVPFIWAGHSW